MRTLLLALLVSLSGTALAQSSARFTIVRGVIASGGTTFSTSARFQLGGTVAQPAASVPAGSRFSVQGGFWIAPPFLLFAPTRNGGNFNISFETTAGRAYVIEYTDSVNPPNWQPPPNVNGDGTVKTVTDSAASTGQRFYRVREQ